MAVSKRLRYEILRRDNHACRYCGATAPDVKLTVDHVTPTALGGTDSPDNLVTACEPCNSGKTSTTADTAIVADVAQDALRWAAAIKQAASELEAQHNPKEKYRTAFKDAWDEWTYPVGNGRKTFELDPEWRTSLERFRQAGLPASVWPDIIEAAMTNKTVKADNLFRYCCGIAWRMVTELQERARSIVGVSTDPESEAEEADVFSAVILQAWVDERGGAIGNEEGRAFEASIARARDRDLPEDAHRLMKAARYSAWFGLTDIELGITAMDRDKAYQGWLSSWYAAAGEYPDEGLTDHVSRQIDALLEAGVYRSRVCRAAGYAGAHRSARLYFGLSEDELAASGQSSVLARISEIWAVSFHATANHWPCKEELDALHASLRNISGDSELLVADVYVAAASAGAYQDSDLHACLPRRLSVFEAAARLLPAA